MMITSSWWFQSGFCLGSISFFKMTDALISNAAIWGFINRMRWHKRSRRRGRWSLLCPFWEKKRAENRWFIDFSFSNPRKLPCVNNLSAIFEARLFPVFPEFHLLATMKKFCSLENGCAKLCSWKRQQQLFQQQLFQVHLVFWWK